MSTARSPMNRVGLGVAAVAFVDLATKVVASGLVRGPGSGALVPLRNHELSLGLASVGFNATVALAAVGIAIAAALLFGPTRRGELAPWIPALILGGALGNLVDRIAFGSVHDFLATPWVVFNLADVAVLAGFVGLAVTRLRRRPALTRSVA